MKFHAGWLCVLIFGIAFGALGQSPDKSYVRIYQMIQEADAMRNSGQSGQAAQRYREAHRELAAFKDGNPTWHPNIVDYRLNYVSTQLQPLGGLESKIAPANASGTAEPPQPAAVGGAAPTDEQLAQLQQEIQRLNTQNALMQDKLKEAWAAQPTPLDPAQLAKAEARIRQLEIERDLLAITLEQEKPRAAPTSDPNLLAEERRILESVKRELAEQRQINADLNQENQTLKQQVTDLKIGPSITPVPNSDVAAQFSHAQATIEALRTTNVALRTEQIFLEMRVADLTKTALNTASQDRVETLESELRLTRTDYQALQKKYSNLEEQIAALRSRTQAGDSAAVTKELNQAQARLAVFEEQAIPYTPEELSLVNHPLSMNLSTATNETARPPQDASELPPGAGALWAQAERAIERGNLEEAENKLREILRQDDSNVFTLSRLARVLMDLKKPEEAEQIIKKALSIDPGDPLGNYLLGSIKYDQQQFDEAFTALSIAAKGNPTNPETQFYLGLTLIRKGNRGPAETALRKAIQLQPNWGAPHYELAFIYANQKPPLAELAQWHYQKAIKGRVPRNLELEKIIEKGPAEN